MLIGRRYIEIREDQNDHKDVVDTQRLLDQIPGKKLKRLFFAELVVDENVEEKREEYPNAGPKQRFFDRNFFCLTVKYSKIEEKHQCDEHVETDPKRGL